MRQHVLLLLAILWIAHGASAAEAQPAATAPAASPTLEGEVANLNRSVQELLVVLKEYLGRQQTDLLFKRIELIQQRMGPLALERKELRARKEAEEEELRESQTAMAVYSSQQDAAKSEKSEKENRAEAAQMLIAEARIKHLKSWISQADQRLAELDSALLQEERNVQRWEALIDQRLGQR